MLIDLRILHKKYNLNINGIIHIGAHYGEENNVYRELNINNIVYVEPIKSTYDILVDSTKDNKNTLYFNTALGNFTGKTMMNMSSNRNTSASILKPKNHLYLSPNVKFQGEVEVNIDLLDNLEFNREDYNMINIDVQGYELEVFKGGKDTLNGIDYIMAEINRDEVYEDCAQLDELIEFLSPYGFELVETNWAGREWGDGFFIKRK